MKPRQPTSICCYNNMFQILLLLMIFRSTNSKMDGFIVGGRETPIQLWPFITFIEIAVDQGTTSACGGSLISSQTVLTAAHCLDDNTMNKQMMERTRFTIYMGHTIHKEATMTRSVVDYETPKDYHPADDDVRSDIGVMFLVRPVKFIANVKKVILKTTFRDTRDRYLEVAGWGRTDPYKPTVNTQKLKSVGIRTITKKICGCLINTIIPKIICASPSHEYAYSGDSGGPLVDKVKRYQLGVVSFRDHNSGITVYTSVPDHYNWIKNTQRSLFKKYCP